LCNQTIFQSSFSFSFKVAIIRNKHLIYEKQEDRTKWKNLFTG